MAAVAPTADIMTIQKNSRILVNVEEALADLLVVSYSSDNKKFQGVLLDSNKCNLPFGVYNLHPAFTKKSVSSENDDNKLHSISQRYAYEDPQYESKNMRVPKKPGPKGKQQPIQKMTVRLRPRKVLCSNCKGICNENSEIVDVSKKRKLDSDEDTSHEAPDSSIPEKKYLMNSTLIPKLSRLHPSEISSAIRGGVKSAKASEKSLKTVKSEKCDSAKNTPELAFVSVTDVNAASDKFETKPETMNPTFSSARTLKICFGEGEGTVVKIPPITENYNEDSGVSCDMSKSESKAAKKAMKRAKRLARKKNAEQIDSWKTHSPKHIGALSPHNNVPTSTSDPLEKKQRHKVKHKKKRKVSKHDENTSKYVESESIGYFSDIKDHCLNQKLSINLRRLSSNSCEKKSEDAHASDSDDGDSDVVPNFPASISESIGSRILRVSTGDIVWGKVVGFPWWPGRVLSVTAARAHVAWFASTTSSLMPCDSLCPFLEDYKVRFNKKKKGPYKEAVKQATVEAQKIEAQLKDPLGSPSHPNLSTMSPHPIDVFS